MKRTGVIFFLLLFVSGGALFALDDDSDIVEFTVDENGNFTGDFLYADEVLPGENEPATAAEPLPQANRKAKARTSLTVSLFYPFYMGTGVDFVEDYAFDPNYGGTPVASKLNGGVDIELRWVLLDHLLIGGGFSWGGTFLFDDTNNFLETSNSSMKVLTLRALIGGIYPLASWVSFFGGVQGGFLQLLESGYLKAINAQYDEIALPCGMIAPFVGFDFILQGGFSISLKADFTAGFSSPNNLLNRSRVETVMYPGIYLGFGMIF